MVDEVVEIITGDLHFLVNLIFKVLKVRDKIKAIKIVELKFLGKKLINFTVVYFNETIINFEELIDYKEALLIEVDF